MTRTHIRATIFLLIATIALAATTTSCSKKNKNQDTEIVDIEQTDDALRMAIEHHDRKQLSSMLDDMALNADDLSPESGVSVLMGYYEMYTQYAGERRSRQAMETMRNFVDVYDIVNANHKENFKRALKKTNPVYPNVDFEEVYAQFQEKLANYDGSWGSVADAEPQESGDSTEVAEADTTDLAPEFRPAE